MGFGLRRGGGDPSGPADRGGVKSIWRGGGGARDGLGSLIGGVGAGLGSLVRGDGAGQTAKAGILAGVESGCPLVAVNRLDVTSR